MQFQLANHPSVGHHLTLLRDQGCPPTLFRHLVGQLATFITYEATMQIATTTRELTTPVARTSGIQLAAPAPVVVPILRAGLGMLDGFLAVIPTAQVRFVGAMRDPVTWQANTYGVKLPPSLAGQAVFVLDPMLATGNSLIAALELIVAREAAQVTVLTIVAAPEGLQAVRDWAETVSVRLQLWSASVDERLNEHGYIVPGLGDAGDRLYATDG